MSENKLKVIILSAGIGSRLDSPYPKPLIRLDNGKSIMQYQIEGLLDYVSFDDIYVVVGFKKDLIMEEFPNLIFLYNSDYDNTNTSKSLLLGLQKLRGNDVLWLNGDVVFEASVLQDIIKFKKSCMAVNVAPVGEEEVKYILSSLGTISQVSKSVVNAKGEAVGINKVSAEDLPLLLDELEQCGDNDYFEKGIEKAIAKGLKIYPIDISDKLCMEIDFEEDLKIVNQLLYRTNL